MIFQLSQIIQSSSNGELDFIAYPVGGEESNALAFMKVIGRKSLYDQDRISFDMSVIYVGILESPQERSRISDEVEQLFFNTIDLIDLENATSAQKQGLEPISENIFNAKDPVGAYNRFQDLIFEYEQKKKDEEDEESIALVVKKSEAFDRIYIYSTKMGIGPLFDEMDGFKILKGLSPKVYFFSGHTFKMFPKPDEVKGLFVMTDDDDDIFYFIPITKGKEEDQNGDSGQGDPGDGDPGDGDPGDGDPGDGDPGDGDPGDGDPRDGDPGDGDPGDGDPGDGDPGDGKPDDNGTCTPGENDPKEGDPRMCGPGGSPNPDDDDFDQEILRISQAIGVRPAQVAASFTSEVRARSLLGGGNFEKLNESRNMSDYIRYVRNLM